MDSPYTLLDQVGRDLHSFLLDKGRHSYLQNIEFPPWQGIGPMLGGFVFLFSTAEVDHVDEIISITITTGSSISHLYFVINALKGGVGDLGLNKANNARQSIKTCLFSS